MRPKLKRMRWEKICSLLSTYFHFLNSEPVVQNIGLVYVLQIVILSLYDDIL